ncbi:hypothetical protein K6119_00640 [Paracrocinitomix mangrovi]|uniref:hypothetical protein n=1 Tax=Paracrocinitomix mangrovi TaxID=2862509 RepID=UPI001C8E5056|nr:hypothetical protein [Paracrocinitomix mangrovi]UKN02022.1 hypothetical protein K6119_00640 [Paracrocinitomix mangrovi]
MEEDLTINEKIHDFIEYGVLNEVDKIRQNLGIWDLIADKIEELKKCEEQVQRLFIHLQYSASDTFTLSLGKIYDTPSNANTRCLRKIFSLLIHHRKEFIREKISFIDIDKLKKVNCPEEILKLLEKPDKNLCVRICEYYKDKIENSPYKEMIEEVFHARNKFVAHSELVKEGHNLKIDLIRELTDLADEFCNVFNIIFMNGGYFRHPNLTSSYFVKKAIAEYAKVP